MKDLRSALAAAARDFYARGWMLGTAGNLSARRDAESFWITASGRPKDALTPEDFVAVDLDGQLLESGPERRPSAETSIHRVIYRHFPSAQVIFHVHSVEANLCGHFAKDGRLRLPPLEMLKGLGIAEVDPQIDLPVFRNHVQVEQIAEDINASFGQNPPRVPGALIHLHGMTAWGAGLTEARHHLELFEFCFRYLSMARLSGLGGES